LGLREKQKGQTLGEWGKRGVGSRTIDKVSGKSTKIQTGCLEKWGQKKEGMGQQSKQMAPM